MEDYDDNGYDAEDEARGLVPVEGRPFKMLPAPGLFELVPFDQIVKEPEGFVVDVDKLAFMCSMGSNLRECSSRLGCNPDVLDKCLKRDYGVSFAEVRNHYFNGSFIPSLRSAQMRKALDGNPTMLKWLGQQYLGQSEKGLADGEDGGEFTSVEEVIQLAKQTVEVRQITKTKMGAQGDRVGGGVGADNLKTNRDSRGYMRKVDATPRKTKGKNVKK